MNDTGYLVLADGHVFEGARIGAPGDTLGELVFTTGTVGCLETLTDPSYYGQIIMQTFPLPREGLYRARAVRRSLKLPLEGRAGRLAGGGRGRRADGRGYPPGHADHTGKGRDERGHRARGHAGDTGEAERIPHPGRGRVSQRANARGV